MNKPLTSIIVLNHNAGDLVVNCIDSILKTIDYDIEVILVDNSSSDGSHKVCKEKFPKIKLIENAENLGYCVGNNIGINHAKGEFIVILNPDTIVEPNWLVELFKAYSKYGDGLYQPKLLTLNKKNIINSAGNMLHIFGFGYSRGKNEVDGGQYDNDEEIGYASGACIFTSTSVLKKIGLFDPFLFVYHDDLDLGWRAAQIGIKSYYIPTAVVYHVGSYHYKWSPSKFYMLEKNRLYCVLTHYSRKTLYKMLPSLIIIEIIVLLFYISKGLLKQKLKGYKTIIQNWKYIQQKYQELEKRKSIPDKVLVKKFPDLMFITDEIANKTSIKLFNKLISKLSIFVKKSL